MENINIGDPDWSNFTGQVLPQDERLVILSLQEAIKSTGRPTVNLVELRQHTSNKLDYSEVKEALHNLKDREFVEYNETLTGEIFGIRLTADGKISVANGGRLIATSPTTVVNLSVNSKGTDDNKKERVYKWAAYATMVTLILAVLTFLGCDVLFGNGEAQEEVYNVQSYNQQGGITAGKINSLNILTDKESLGIRELDGLYQNSKKVGRVINFTADEETSTFTIAEIEFDQPLRNQDLVWQPYEFQNYTLKIQQINNLVTLMPAGARGVSGIILSIK